MKYLNNSIKLSVIVPIYNCEKYLDRALNSLINQTYQNIEILLINDASTDSSLEICQKYQKKDTRVKIINKSKNTGVSDSRNIGIESANGEYITFFDSDDFIDLKAYEECMKLVELKELDIIRFSYVKEFGNYKNYRHLKTITKKVIQKEHFATEIYPNIFNSEDYTSVWNAIIRKEIIKNIRFNVNIKFAEDFLFNINVMMNSNSLYLMDKPYYHYIVNCDSATQKYNSEKIMDRIDNILVANTEVLNILGKSQYNIREYTIKIILAMKEKIGLIAYYDTYQNYKKIVHEIKLLDSYRNFIVIAGYDYELKISYYNFLKLKLKTGIKEIIKNIMRKNK